jgi:uncharacterized membrane protein
VFAAGLRFFRLGEWSFWYDEIFTLRSIGALPGTSFSGLGFSKVLIALAANTFGLSEWAVRLVPALIGIVTIPVLYFPIKDMYNTRVAVVASLLLAVSTWHLYWSQNARFYTTLLLFSTLALIFFYYGIEKDKPVYLFLFLVFLGLAVRERMFAVILVPIVGIYLLCLKFLPFEKPRGLNTRNLLVLIVPVVIFGGVLGWSIVQDIDSYLEGFGRVNTNPLWIISGTVYYIGIPVVLMGAAGGAYRLVSSRDRATLLFSLAAVLPILLVTTLALVQYAANRYIFITLTSWIILASIAVDEVFTNTRGSARILATGIILILFIEPMGESLLYYQYQNGNRDDWKGAFHRIEQLSEPEDLVVVTEPLVGKYYLDRQVVGIESLDLDSLLESGRRVWFVEDNNLESKYPEKFNWISDHAQLFYNHDINVRARVFKMRVYRFDPGPNYSLPSTQ